MREFKKKKYSHEYLKLNKVRITLFGFPPRPRLHRRTCPLSSPPPPFPATATVTSAALSSLPPLIPAAPSFKEGEGEASTNRRREQDLRRGWPPRAAMGAVRRRTAPSASSCRRRRRSCIRWSPESSWYVSIFSLFML